MPIKILLIKLNECMNEKIRTIMISPSVNVLTNCGWRSIALLSRVDGEKMASIVNLSPSYVQSLYKKFFHISCIVDLISSRMDRAQQMLIVTDYPIKRFLCFAAMNPIFIFPGILKKRQG